MFRAEVIGSMLRPAYLQERGRPSRQAGWRGRVQAGRGPSGRSGDRAAGGRRRRSGHRRRDAALATSMGPLTETVDGIEPVPDHTPMPWSTPDGRDIELGVADSRDVEAAQAALAGDRGVQLRARTREAAAEGDAAEPADAVRARGPRALDRRLPGSLCDVCRRRRDRALGDVKELASLGLRVHPDRRAELATLVDPRVRDWYASRGLRRRADALGGNRADQRRRVRTSRACASASTSAAATTRACGCRDRRLRLHRQGAVRASHSASTRFFLEYDDERSGSFEPLADVPDDKQIVLGLISTKRPEPESAEAIGRESTTPRASSRASSWPVDAVRLRVDRERQPDHGSGTRR